MGISFLPGVRAFIDGWSPSYMSMVHGTHVREVNQGGNYLLTCVPQASQAMWTGQIIGKVGSVASGPLKWIVQLTRCLFSPFVSGPLALAAASVKENFYHGSISQSLPAQTKHYLIGVRVPRAIRGTVTAVVEGVPKHFMQGNDISRSVNRSTKIIKNGQEKYYRYRLVEFPLDDRAPPDRIKEIMIDGELRRVRLLWENTEEVQPRIEIFANGRRLHFERGKEVPVPIAGTVVITDEYGIERNHVLGAEVPAPVPGSVEITLPGQPVHYELGMEVSSPSNQTQTFGIDGKARHFSSAKNVIRPSLGISGLLNKIPRIPFKLPTRLSIYSIKVFNFIAEHGSRVIRVVTVIAGVALGILGHPFLAVGVLVAVTYEYLDHDLKVVPRKVSLFVERWMPLVSLVGLILVGSVASQVTAAVSLLLYIPAVNQYMHHKIDFFIRRRVVGPLFSLVVAAVSKINQRRGEGVVDGSERLKVEERIKALPLLAEVDAPLVQNRGLKFNEIEKICQGGNELYEINPAHLSKSVEPLVPLPESREFEKLIELWDKIGPRWMEEAYYQRLFGRLLDDKRFIIFLQQRFPEIRRFHYEGDHTDRRSYERAHGVYRNQVEGCIIQLAAENGQTKNAFVAAWVREQLRLFVEKLLGRGGIEGSQGDLDLTIQNMTKVLPWLLRPGATGVEIEDAVVKMGIEGGDYCALACKRVSSELLEGVVEAQPLPDVLVDERVRFEREIFLALLRLRSQIFQGGFSGIVGELRSKASLQDTADDLHLYEAADRMVKRGFYPLSSSQQEDFGVTDLLLWETVLIPARIMLYETYKQKISDVMNAVGINRRGPGNRVLDYLRNWVNQNPALSPEEKGRLLRGVLSNSDDNLADPDLYPKINRLILVILGVIREKRIQGVSS